MEQRTTDEERLGQERLFVCPCCRQYAQRAYDLDGREVCGFCRGIGPDGMLTGKHGSHPDAKHQSRVSVSAEDAWILFTVVTSVEDLGDEEAAAADRLALALRNVR